MASLTRTTFEITPICDDPNGLSAKLLVSRVDTANLSISSAVPNGECSILFNDCGVVGLSVSALVSSLRTNETIYVGFQPCSDYNQVLQIVNTKLTKDSFTGRLSKHSTGGPISIDYYLSDVYDGFIYKPVNSADQVLWSCNINNGSGKYEPFGVITIFYDTDRNAVKPFEFVRKITVTMKLSFRPSLPSNGMVYDEVSYYEGIDIVPTSSCSNSILAPVCVRNCLSFLHSSVSTIIGLPNQHGMNVDDEE